MLKFRCEGIMRESGESASIEVSARNVEEAIEKANKCGIMVENTTFLEIFDPPIVRAEFVQGVQKVQLIEHTSKEYKKAQLIGGAMVVAGFVLIYSLPDSQDAVGFGGLMVAVGALTWLIARIGAWWDHG